MGAQPVLYGLLLIAPLLNACFNSNDECNDNPTVWSMGMLETTVGPLDSRVEFRFSLELTEEGSAQAGTELRTASRLFLGLTPETGDVQLTERGVSVVEDGEETPYTEGTHRAGGVEVPNPFGDCAPGPCLREYVVWAGVAREGTVTAQGIFIASVESTCEQARRWLRHDLESVAGTGSEPLDGGL
jgi:hypothetical protein